MTTTNPGSIEQQWQAVQDKVKDAIQTHFPVEGRTRKLVLNGLQVEEKGLSHSDIHSQEEAKNAGRTWGAGIYGDVSLIDKATGKVIDRSKVKLVNLPKPTNRYSYIVDGSEWQVDSLWTLRSGVYAHSQQNGQFQAEFNLSKAFAKHPRLYVPFDPEKKQFRLKYAGSSKIPLYSVLKTLGVSDEDMKKAWGADIYNANLSKKVDADIKDFYDKLNKNGGVKASSDKQDDLAAAVYNAFDQSRLLPETTKTVLGEPIDRVNGKALLLASQRILKVARGDIPEDDRDSLVFKKLNSLDDFLHHRLTHFTTKRAVSNKIGNNIDRQEAVRDIISSDIFNRPIHEFFTSSNLSRNAEQVNPLEMMSNYRSTTILAEKEGGIKSEKEITGAMKLINPSHLGFLDPIHTPESEKTGISLNLPIGVVKDGNTAKAPVYDLKEGKLVYVSPTDLHTEMVVFPDQVKWEKSKPVPIASSVKMKDPHTHEITEKPLKEGRYLLFSAHQLFDESTNLIPFLQNNQGNRTMMAAKQTTQAVSLHHREQPLVQVKTEGKDTWERVVGKPWSHSSPVDGEVIGLKKNKDNGHTDSIIVKDAQGKKHEIQLYNHFAVNDAKSFLHSTPVVNIGDKVTKGQLIADTNYTKNGALTLGTNLRVSYLPYKGYNFDDGIVISDSAAKKLTSEHVHRHSIEIDPDKDTVSTAKYLAYASNMSRKVTKDQIKHLDEKGVIRVGSKVMPGDVLIAAVGKRDLAGETARAIGRLDKKLFSLQDKSVVWDTAHPGEVVKVVHHPGGKGITVHVKTLEGAEVGDKIVGRHGNKGIITRILPDHEMPKVGSKDGDHVEVLMNPSGVPSRINLGQMLETAASKIAAKTGQPYLVQNFAGPDIDYTQKVKDDLKKHGVSDTETLFDPTTGRKLGDALTGHQYILKLKHQVEKKLAVRSNGPNYTIDHAPKGTGAEHPGQAIGQLEFYALLAHGARANLREIATYKADQHLGDKMDPNSSLEFWERVKTGQPLPPPQPTFAYKKFLALLNGLGIDVKKEGHQLVLQPLTDKGVLSLSHGEIPDPGRVLRGKDAKELEKGLFDPKITGGLPNDTGKGLHWAHISLSEPLPNPIFVGTPQHPGPAVVLTGMKFNDFEEVARGKKAVEGMTGGKAIETLLKKIDVKSELKKVQSQLPSLHGTDLDKANRKARYLMALDSLGMRPHEAYVMNHVPVLPPIFRPIVPMQDGSLRFDDVNQLYKDIGHINDQLKTRTKGLPEEEHNDLRSDLYDAVKSLAGLGTKPVYESNRKLRGILEQISGDQPKLGLFQKKIMKRRQELSMRSTIIPEPAMHLDHVGLPREAALELYKPFVVRELRTIGGYSPIEALKKIKGQEPIVWKALESAMEKRPVMLKRDPALHKFSIMAFKPKLVDGKAIRIHPLVTSGYNADFDGDTMSAFVPLSDEAVREAHRMFPSNNLFSSTNGDIMYAPSQESLLGLHLLSQWGKPVNKSFTTFAEAQKAYDKGVIGATDVVKIGGRPTTLGRLLITQPLPEFIKRDPNFVKKLSDPKAELLKQEKGESSWGLYNLLDDVAKKDKQKFSSVVDELKNLGNRFVYELGFSFKLKDLNVNKKLREQILKKYDVQAAAIKAKSGISNQEKSAQLEDLYNKATTDLVKQHEEQFKAEGNNIYKMVSSGAKGKMSQFRQMVIAPMLMKDGSGKTITTPITKSYAEGLDSGDYWTSLHGARMGTLQRVEGTSEPGALTKDIVNVVIPNLIMSKDCGTNEGVSMEIHEDDVHDRFLAVPVKVGSTVLKAGTLITPEVIANLKKNKVDKVVVRSPLKCSHPKGICSKCYGLNENGELHEMGTNIGVIAGQSMGEPATQLAMDSFHTGGVAASRGGASVDKFTRLNQLLSVPKTLPNAATLAKVSGKVSKMEKDKATNGWNVYVGEEKHYIPAQRTPLVNGKPLGVGSTVSKGEPITDGSINPREMLPLTNIHAVQNYLVHELYHSIYKDEGVRRRNLETVVRSLTNLTRVKDPGESDHLPGDIAQRTVIEAHNRNLKPGQAPITHEPILRRAEDVALDQHEDWMARLNFQQIRNTLLEGTAKGWRTDLHGTNPIPAYAHGAEFGKGTTDKPHHY